MKKVLLIAAAIVLSGTVMAQKNSKQSETMKFENKNDSVSYSLGISIGNNLQQSGFDQLNFELVKKGMSDTYAGSGAMDINAANGIVQGYMQAKKSESANKNKAEGDKFLAETKKKDGVKSTESGLLYEVLKVGTGEKPGPTDKVKTHYHGTLIDGTVFDSSVDRGEPISFPVNGVIAGWTEALQMMPVGSKWKLYIPGNLAYGERGAGGSIGPNATLIFEVELLEIEK
ncbi:MAG TPA: FKBP-type peptidyl-prolyl cis-trans isomerase [Bacteroidia bacterium]|nr:FKBP-type peptidyl-prolyl cis-trans isomerase [Bacteroidia bacterium]HNT80444.1 FKBP-type peptidyl-prolyl cis-trans isomerase [Bacteroidia bacterium]